MLGFVNAVAIIIAGLQLGNLLGVHVVITTQYYQTIIQVLTDAAVGVHLPTVGLAALALVIIISCRWFWPRFPSALLAVIVTTLIAWLTGYQQLETVRVSQIISPRVQELLTEYRQYPEEMKQQLAKVGKAEGVVKTIAETSGSGIENFSTKNIDDAINRVSQAQWQMERLVAHHNEAVGELSRLRLRRLRIDGKQIMYYVDGQIPPIGQIDSNKWQIADLPKNGTLKVRSGGEVVGEVLQGLPSFQPVIFNLDAASQLFLAALVIALVGFTEAITIAKRIATETRHSLNINQELLGQGIAKCVSGFFQGMPVSGSFACTVVNYSSGAKTGFSSVITGLAVMVVLLWLTPLFYYLPYATLAVVIIVNVLGLVNFKEIIRVWRVNRNEGMVALTTFLLTLFLAPRLAHAVVLGMLLSLGVYLYETMRPRFTELVRDDEGGLSGYADGDSRDRCSLASLLRFNGSLYFANGAFFEEKILQLIHERTKLRYIIIDFSRIDKLDASGLEILLNLSLRLQDAGIELWFTRVRHAVFAVLKRGGLYEKLGEDHFFRSNDEALEKLSECLGEKHMNACPLVQHDSPMR